VPIRVAYDISVIAKEFAVQKHTFGIFRVVDEILRGLRSYEDLEITPAVLCLPPLLAYAEAFETYLTEWQGMEKGQFFTRRHERRALKQAINSLDTLCNAPWVTRHPRLMLPVALAFKAMRKALRAVPVREVTYSNERKSYDIYHSTYLPFPSRRATGAGQRILTIYDLIPVMAPQFCIDPIIQSYKQLLSSLVPQQDWAICISDFTKQELCAYTGMAPERVFVTLLAADAKFYPEQDAERIADVRRRYGIPAGEYFLSLARIEGRKNFVRLLNAFARLLRESPDLPLTLVLVGELGKNYEDILSASDDLEAIRGRVVFTGYVEEQDISAVYSGAKAFLFPSLYEGFGLPPLEAMQCGVPVITSNTTSLPEVVGDAGIMVDPTDMDALCAAMLEVATNDQLCGELRERGLARARQFSWAKSAQQTAEVYRFIMANT